MLTVGSATARWPLSHFERKRDPGLSNGLYVPDRTHPGEGVEMKPITTMVAAVLVAALGAVASAGTITIAKHRTRNHSSTC